jgi:hypothetical protein
LNAREELAFKTATKFNGKLQTASSFGLDQAPSNSEKVFLGCSFSLSLPVSCQVEIMNFDLIICTLSLK